MRRLYKPVILFVSICLYSFMSLYPSLKNNNVTFTTDEIYWIQTARVVPYMLEQKFSDIFWNEHVGFTNFYGAKWVYAIGLRLFGYSNFSGIHYPPRHIDQFGEFDGKVFPSNNSHYGMISHARTISILTACVGIGFFSIFAYFMLGNSIVAALFSAMLLLYHPIIRYIGMHALADSMFFTGHMASLVVLSVLLQSHFKKAMLYYVILGCILGYTMSVKINGFIYFAMYIITLVLWSYRYNLSIRFMITTLIVTTISVEITFLLIHPNFFFFPHYSVPQMIADRIFITKYHMNYFTQIDRPHVLFTLSERIMAMNRHIFTDSVRFFFSVGAFSHLILLIRRRPIMLWKSMAFVWLHIIGIGISLLVYVVFDDQRYFLPLLPFICIYSVSWIPLALTYISKAGRYWSASAR